MVKRMLHVKMGSLDQVIPFLRIISMVVMKLTDDRTMEATSIATTNAPNVIPSSGLYFNVLSGA